MKQKFLAALLAAALLVTALPAGVPALAAADEAPVPEDELFALAEPSAFGEIPVTVGRPAEETGEALTAEAPTLTAREEAALALAEEDGSGLPRKYDPRGEAFLTPVRAQGSWNSCWAMAAMAAAEITGLKRGLLPGPAAATDLSERHLIYFFSHRAEDPLGNSSGDYNVNPSFWLSNGGNPVVASMTLAGWHGPAGEAATDSAYSGLKEGDSLAERFAYADALHLQNTYVFDIDDAAGRETLKAMLLDYGAAVLCLYFGTRWLYAGPPAVSKEEAPSAPAEEPPAAEALPEEALTEKTQEPSAPEADVPGDEDVAEIVGDDPAPEEALTDEPEPAEEDASAEAPGAADAAEDGEPEAPSPDGTEPEGPLPAEAPQEEAPPAGDAAEAPLPEGSDELPEAAPVLDGAAEADPAPADAAEERTVCYYQNSRTTTNHEVVVVGWDDDYPAENFALSEAGALPPGDGAWLCRNTQEPETRGEEGYFWLSYYDLSAAASTGGIISGRVTVFDFGPPDDYDNNYEYDGAAVLGYVNDAVDGRGVSTTSADSSTRRWYANVFTAGASAAGRVRERLTAVSTYSYRPGVGYTVRVYTDLTDPADPASGTLAAEASGTFPRAGYHTVTLPAAVTLEAGDRFSVVFCVGMAEDRSVFVPACYTSSSWYSTNENRPGQSFVSLDGTSWLEGTTLKNEPNVRIKAFTVNEPLAFGFDDVSESAWYYSDVRDAWNAGLVNGVSADRYQPGAPATRAQVVATLWRLAGRPTPADAAPFTDVVPDQWYAEAVAWAAENGVANGYEDGRFLPGAAVTRQEFITLLYRFAALRGAETGSRAELSAFPDRGLVADWAAEAEAWSLAAGLQRGVAVTGGTVLLAPAGNVTRAQLAAFLNRLALLL